MSEGSFEGKKPVLINSTNLELEQDKTNMDEEEEKKETSKKEDLVLAPEVKSAAVVKYSAVQVPATFTRLSCNTNLNLPPSNWLSNSAETYGLRPASFFHRSAFSSFSMAHMFPDCVGEVDVVSDAENVKKLLKIPYSNGPVSMMIHRIENTLLIDEFDVHKYLLREAESQWEWFKKFFIEHIMQSAGAKDKLVHRRENSRNALQQKSLVSKFLYHSLVVADSGKTKPEKSADEPESADPSIPIPLPYKNDPPLPDPTLEEELPDPTSNHKFSRNVVWTFEDIQMLLGTDMPIFGGGTHPCISLRLRDMTKPINVLTGMDYWLDNLMCNVPEVVMCYHLNGIVQKYELIKTEDLPNLENSKFSPKVIRDIAQNILSFLKANATKAGHTYWLFKGKDDDVVKLYDLTSLCTDVMDEKGQTPFTVPVAMLLYRVARNMKNSPEGMRQPGTIRMLLKNCVSLLSSEKYPEIVTSAHYMLADLYIPSDINPASPELFSDEETAPEATSEDKVNTEDSKSEEMAIKSLSLANIREVHMDEAEFLSPPPPLGKDVESRCNDSMKHVLEGLKSLKFLRDSEDKKETTKEEEPAMAKPFQTIPMEYQSLAKDTEDEKKGGKKKKRKNKKDKAADDSGKSLLCKSKAEAIPTWRPFTPKNSTSWKVHLKVLLYEKMCLIYATLLEKAYSEGRFGLTLHYIRMVLKARKVLKPLRGDLCIDGIESYLLGRAGDAFFMVVQNSQKFDSFNKDYCSSSDFDLEAIDQLKNDGLECNEEGDFPKKLKNLEELLLSSCRCYQKALEADVSDSENENLQRRLGNIENELGVYYMNQAEAKYQEELTSKKDGSQTSKFKELFALSLQHLEAGIKAFDSIKDEANLALLHSNTGRLMRLRAHFHSPNQNDRKELAGQERHFYGKAIASYQKALQVLGERKYNTAIWDFVNWELSTALYTMATLLQDYPACVKSQEEAEREVTETLHKALKYCDVDTPGMRQPVYQFRSAMIHHRLASLYHKSYRTPSEDEGKKKKILQLCKLQYEKAAKLLLYLEHSAEYLRVQLERVALAEVQAEGAGSINIKIKHHECALELLFEAANILKMISERDLSFYDNEKEKSSENEGDEEKKGKKDEEKSEMENELTLLGFFEQRLHFNLLSLTKLYTSRKDSKKEVTNIGEIYKNQYVKALRVTHSKSNPVEFAKSLYSLITDISENLKPALGSRRDVRS